MTSLRWLLTQSPFKSGFKSVPDSLIAFSILLSSSASSFSKSGEKPWVLPHSLLPCIIRRFNVLKNRRGFSKSNPVIALILLWNSPPSTDLISPEFSITFLRLSPFLPKLIAACALLRQTSSSPANLPLSIPKILSYSSTRLAWIGGRSSFVLSLKLLTETVTVTFGIINSLESLGYKPSFTM